MESSMRRAIAILAVTLGCAAQAGIASAQDAAQFFDLKGRWLATSESIVLGNALHHGAGQDKPRLSAVEITLTIEGQDGRRFWGTVASQADREPLVGVISFDNKTISAHDSDGTLQGTIVDKDTVEVIYSHTGSSTVVTAARFKRQK
jgi:hypothetical protein